MKRLTEGWVRKAESNFISATVLREHAQRQHDEICFFCQQSAEKYLKALLAERNETIPKTHNLVAILRLITPHHPEFRTFRRGLDFLTRFAVDTRYPGDDAGFRQAAAALRWAERIREVCRSLLGIDGSRVRKPKRQ